MFYLKDSAMDLPTLMWHTQITLLGSLINSSTTFYFDKYPQTKNYRKISLRGGVKIPPQRSGRVNLTYILKFVTLEMRSMSNQTVLFGKM